MYERLIINILEGKEPASTDVAKVWQETKRLNNSVNELLLVTQLTIQNLKNKARILEVNLQEKKDEIEKVRMRNDLLEDKLAMANSQIEELLQNKNS